MRERCLISVGGSVQGVGFRPFVFRLAARHGLAGSVRNDGRGVAIELEGDPTALDRFVNGLRGQLPPLARVDRVDIDRSAAIGLSGFRIGESCTSGPANTAIPADVATCDACLAELFDPADRRHRFPFINCTDCGPRLTIVEGLPYDRFRTTMARFEMCAECRAEYENPLDRRFHAEPVACPACGPRLTLRDAMGAVVAGDPLHVSAEALSAGAILAIKGLGGYHLACDATNGDAVERLRRRKHRPAKPLAVMVRDLAAFRALCLAGPEEELLLASPERPIVLVRKRPDGGVADAVASGLPDLGLMLPYTPVHYLLLEQAGRPLVMTSGNRSDEPIAFRDEDAHARLAGIADLFLDHDRPIAMRCDDSIARMVGGTVSLVRRSRGYAPQPLALAAGSDAPLLAVGGDLKNTFALVRGQEAFLSHYVGDLHDLDSYAAFDEAVGHYSRLLGIRPQVVAHDLHPGYLSTRRALELDADEHIPVQHHHAHFAACLAEHGITQPAIGVVFDGTGYGPDGSVWGGEFLIGDCRAVERAGHLGSVPLPGGDAAVREPWRAAVAHLVCAFGSTAESAATDLLERVGEKRWSAVKVMSGRRELSAPTSSVGRLFDAVSAIIGLRDRIDYEAQAAIELEAIADPGESRCYPIELECTSGRWIWRPEPVIKAVVDDLRRTPPRPAIAAAFHNTVAAATTVVCERLRSASGLNRVALTGGVFLNTLLLRRAAGNLSAVGFEVLTHRRVPANDGGLSFGQAAVACAVHAARR